MGITLSWLLSPQSRGIKPVHPHEHDHEVWLDLVVGLGQGKRTAVEIRKEGKRVAVEDKLKSQWTLPEVRGNANLSCR